VCRRPPGASRGATCSLRYHRRLLERAAKSYAHRAHRLHPGRGGLWPTRPTTPGLELLANVSTRDERVSRCHLGLAVADGRMPIAGSRQSASTLSETSSRQRAVPSSRPCPRARAPHSILRKRQDTPRPPRIRNPQTMARWGGRERAELPADERDVRAPRLRTQRAPTRVGRRHGRDLVGEACPAGRGLPRGSTLATGRRRRERWRDHPRPLGRKRLARNCLTVK
jgi:hypothetical protein